MSVLEELREESSEEKSIGRVVCMCVLVCSKEK